MLASINKADEGNMLLSDLVWFVCVFIKCMKLTDVCFVQQQPGPIDRNCILQLSMSANLSFIYMSYINIIHVTSLFLLVWNISA